jgi:hypothetical protein
MTSCIEGIGRCALLWTVNVRVDADGMRLTADLLGAAIMFARSVDRKEEYVRY